MIDFLHGYDFYEIACSPHLCHYFMLLEALMGGEFVMYICHKIQMYELIIYDSEYMHICNLLC